MAPRLIPWAVVTIRLRAAWLPRPCDCPAGGAGRELIGPSGTSDTSARAARRRHGTGPAREVRVSCQRWKTMSARWTLWYQSRPDRGYKDAFLVPGGRMPRMREAGSASRFGLTVICLGLGVLSRRASGRCNVLLVLPSLPNVEDTARMARPETSTRIMTNLAGDRCAVLVARAGRHAVSPCCLAGGNASQRADHLVFGDGRRQA